MKRLLQYILEDNETYNDMSSKAKKLFWPSWIDMLKGNKFNKDNIIDMLSKFDNKDLKELSDCLFNIDSKNYLPYQPSTDEFLIKKNNDKIKNQISEYIYKNICNK